MVHYLKRQMDMEKMGERMWSSWDSLWDYTNTKEEEYKFCAIASAYEHKLAESTFKGLGSNPYIIYRWSKVAGEVYGKAFTMHTINF